MKEEQLGVEILNSKINILIKILIRLLSYNLTSI